MNFVNKKAILALTLLVSPILFAAEPKVGAAEEEKHKQNTAKGATASTSWYDAVSGYASSGFGVARDHPWYSGSAIVAAGAGLLYKFNESVRNNVNSAASAVKAKVSAGYSAVRSKIKPVLDRQVTLGDAAVVTGLGVIGTLAYMLKPDSWNKANLDIKCEAAKKYWNDSTNKWYAIGGTAAVATLAFVSVKAYKAHKAAKAVKPTEEPGASSSAGSTGADDSDDDEL